MSGQTIAGVPIEETTVAAFLNDLAAAQYPRMVFNEICDKYELSTNAGLVLANRNGYPDRRRLQRAADEATNRARIAAPKIVDHTPVVDRPHPPAPHVDAQEVEAERLLEVPLTRIAADPHNVRKELTEIQELADSIRETGLLQPIVLRPSDTKGDDQLILVMGHRRRAAFELLGRDTIPAIVRGAMLPDEVLAAMLIENTQRVGLNPIEEARGIQRLMVSTGVTTHQVLGKKIGRSQPYISARLQLLSLDEQTQAAVAAGTMSIGAAVAKARKSNGTFRPNAQGKASGAHLDFNHRLASAVENLCSVVQKHSKQRPGRVGDVGCGECWEAVIRGDERLQVQRGRKTDKADLEQLEQLRHDLVDLMQRVDVDEDSIEALVTQLNTLLEGTPA